MQVDIKASDIRPIGQTFSHVARRLGDKPASREAHARLRLPDSRDIGIRAFALALVPPHALQD